ncbi:MAG: glycosyltransferase family 2 protein [Rhodocyclaceae bacterium]|nr:glycosyltransferase family 2 protein [Rhodocyclaceae bacterium]
MAGTEVAPPGTGAVIVAYHPDDGLAQRISAILPQFQAVLIVDNTPEAYRDPRLMSLAEANPAGVELMANPENLGVAAALNQGLAWAHHRGFLWLVTLDQDSHIYPNLVETLTGIALSLDKQPMVVGGNYLDPRNGRLAANREGVVPYEVRKTVITSGSLVSVEAAIAIGGFREDYFIDQLDHEFCLRARRHGYQVLISRKPVMDHSVGEEGGVRLPFLGTLPNHSPLRKYYITRNSLVTILEYWREEPDWCARRLIRLLLGFLLMGVLEQNRLDKIRAFLAGVRDAMDRQMGPCPHERLRLRD